MASRYQRLDENSGLGAVAKGSYGRVYVAVDTRTQATVAVKRQVLPSNSAMSELCWYKALSQSPHPNIMSLLDHFVAKGAVGTCLYMVFDFVDTTLWYMWKQRRRVVPMNLCCGLASDLLHGVAHLHDSGIVHTDLSMANMLVGPLSSSSSASSHGRLRITDLGGAISALGVVLPAEKIISTEYVRAPEVILGERKPTEAVDLWAVGVVIMALVCGSLVFWRPEGLEPSVEGLLPAGDDAESAEPTSSLLMPGARTLANQVAVLGSICEDVFPGCRALPHWSKLQDEIRGSALCLQPSLFLCDSCFVRRPLAASDSALSLILSFLSWNPAGRLRAKQCVHHAFLQGTISCSSGARSLVDKVSVAHLREIVLESLHFGRAVEFETVLMRAMDNQKVVAESAGAGLASSHGDACPVSASGKSDVGAELMVVAESAGPGLASSHGAACHMSESEKSVVEFEPKRRRIRGKGGRRSGLPADLKALSQVASTSVVPADSQALSQVESKSVVQADTQQQSMCALNAASSQGGANPCAASSHGSLQASTLDLRFVQLCDCKGNCGLETCKSRKNKYVRGYSEDSQFCQRPAVLGTSYCCFCRCEKCSVKTRQEVHGYSRWCTTCGQDFKFSSRQVVYHNLYGTYRVESDWSCALQMTARYAWVSNLAPGVEAAFFFFRASVFAGEGFEPSNRLGQSC